MDQSANRKICNQAMLSQEAYGILLSLLHNNSIDCCLSPSCVTEFVEVIRTTGHDDSFVFFCLNSGPELCGSGARVAVTQQ